MHKGFIKIYPGKIIKKGAFSYFLDLKILYKAAIHFNRASKSAGCLVFTI